MISDNHNATLQNILKLEIEQYEIIISELWYTNAQCVLQTKIEEAIHLIVYHCSAIKYLSKKPIIPESYQHAYTDTCQGWTLPLVLS